MNAAAQDRKVQDRKVQSLTAEERFVADAKHWEKKDDLIVCKLCPRECEVPRDERGYCGVRENRNDEYKTLVHSRPCTIHVDPIEKKPLSHFLPGTKAFSLATAGCNVECKFCQNWQISQMRPEQVDAGYYPPDQIVSEAKRTTAQSIAFTYTEPVIFYEYMFDIAAAAKPAGVHPVMISNGYIQAKPMEELCPHLSAVKVDLKAFTEKFYKETCSGELAPVLETLKRVKKAGVWLELVVLIIPTLNDGADECKAMCEWIGENLGPDVPIHFTRFHAMYKLKNLPPTPVDVLTRNYETAKSTGLHFPYVGNVPGHPGEHTHCPKCDTTVIERYGYRIENHLKDHDHCPKCNEKIPGFWM